MSLYFFSPANLLIWVSLLALVVGTAFNRWRLNLRRKKELDAQLQAADGGGPGGGEMVEMSQMSEMREEIRNDGKKTVRSQRDGGTKQPLLQNGETVNSNGNAQESKTSLQTSTCRSQNQNQQPVLSSAQIDRIARACPVSSQNSSVVVQNSQQPSRLTRARGMTSLFRETREPRSAREGQNEGHNSFKENNEDSENKKNATHTTESPSSSSSPDSESHLLVNGYDRPLFGTILYRSWILFVFITQIALLLLNLVLFFGNSDNYAVHIANAMWGLQLCPETFFYGEANGSTDNGEPNFTYPSFCSTPVQITSDEDLALRFGGIFLVTWFLAEAILICFFMWDMRGLFLRECENLGEATVVSIIDSSSGSSSAESESSDKKAKTESGSSDTAKEVGSKQQAITDCRPTANGSITIDVNAEQNGNNHNDYDVNDREKKESAPPSWASRIATKFSEKLQKFQDGNTKQYIDVHEEVLDSETSGEGNQHENGANSDGNKKRVQKYFFYHCIKYVYVDFEVDAETGEHREVRAFLPSTSTIEPTSAEIGVALRRLRTNTNAKHSNTKHSDTPSHSNTNESPSDSARIGPFSTLQSTSLQQRIYGKNIIEIEEATFTKCIGQEFAGSFFYIFQIMTMWLFISIRSWFVAISWEASFVLCGVIKSYYALISNRKIQEMARFRTDVGVVRKTVGGGADPNTNRDTVGRDANTNRLRNAGYDNSDNYTSETISSENLIPGDVIEIRDGLVLTCDCVLIHGDVIMNEAALTGECTPIQKFVIDTNGTDTSSAILPSTHKSHFLFAGTTVFNAGAGASDCANSTDTNNTGIQATTNSNSTASSHATDACLAVVVGIGAGTTRGELVRHMFDPKSGRAQGGEGNFDFFNQLTKLIAAELLIGVPLTGILLLFTTGVLYQPSIIVIVISQVISTMNNLISPFLPVAMTNASMNSAGRLEKKGVFCMESDRIPVAGKLDVFCFDKTGTITKDGMSFVGVRTWEGRDNAGESGDGKSENMGDLQNTGVIVQIAGDGDGENGGGADGKRDTMRSKKHDRRSESANPKNPKNASNSSGTLISYEATRPKAAENFNRELAESDAELLRAMACCHSVSEVWKKAGGGENGKLVKQIIGNPVEQQMVKCLGWAQEKREKKVQEKQVHEKELQGTISGEIQASSSTDNNTTSISGQQEILYTNPFVKGKGIKGAPSAKSALPQTDQVAVIRKWEFDQHRQCQTVIARKNVDDSISNSETASGKEQRKETSSYQIFSKGSPEKIQSICVQESLPPNLSDLVKDYARNGYYCIAVGTKDVQVGKGIGGDGGSGDSNTDGKRQFKSQASEGSHMPATPLNNQTCQKGSPHTKSPPQKEASPLSLGKGSANNSDQNNFNETKCDGKQIQCETDTGVKTTTAIAKVSESVIQQHQPETLTDIANLSRDAAETELNFVGLLLFKNEMKPESPSVMRELKAGNIKQVMITGDSVFTGVAIGRQCGMLDMPDPAQKRPVWVGDLVESDSQSDSQTESNGPQMTIMWENFDYPKLRLTTSQLLRQVTKVTEWSNINLDWVKKLAAAKAVARKPRNKKKEDGKDEPEEKNATDDGEKGVVLPFDLAITEKAYFEALRLEEEAKAKRDADVNNDDGENGNRYGRHEDYTSSGTPLSQKTRWTEQSFPEEEGYGTRSHNGNAISERSSDKLSGAYSGMFSTEITNKNLPGYLPFSSYGGGGASHWRATFSGSNLNENLHFSSHIFPYIKIFGRSKPAGKKHIIAKLQTDMKFVVGMTGDGGNDTGALRQADIGLALVDEAEEFDAESEGEECADDVGMSNEAEFNMEDQANDENDLSTLRVRLSMGDREGANKGTALRKQTKKANKDRSKANSQVQNSINTTKSENKEKSSQKKQHKSANIVAPFVSQGKQIFSVIEIIREGRCSLDHCISVLLWFLSWGIIWVLTAKLFVLQKNAFMPMCAWVFNDVVLVLFLPCAMTRSGPSEVKRIQKSQVKKEEAAKDKVEKEAESNDNESDEPKAKNRKRSRSRSKSADAGRKSSRKRKGDRSKDAEKESNDATKADEESQCKSVKVVDVVSSRNLKNAAAGKIQFADSTADKSSDSSDSEEQFATYLSSNSPDSKVFARRFLVNEFLVSSVLSLSPLILIYIYVDTPIGAFFGGNAQDWYKSVNFARDGVETGADTSGRSHNYDCVWIVLNQVLTTLILAAIVSFGNSFKKSIWSNWLLVGFIAGCFIFTVWPLIWTAPNKINCIWHTNCDNETFEALWGPETAYHGPQQEMKTIQTLRDAAFVVQEKEQKNEMQGQTVENESKHHQHGGPHAHEDFHLVPFSVAGLAMTSDLGHSDTTTVLMSQARLWRCQEFQRVFTEKAHHRDDELVSLLAYPRQELGVSDEGVFSCAVGITREGYEWFRSGGHPAHWVESDESEEPVDIIVHEGEDPERLQSVQEVPESAAKHDDASGADKPENEFQDSVAHKHQTSTSGFEAHRDHDHHGDHDHHDHKVVGVSHHGDHDHHDHAVIAADDHHLLYMEHNPHHLHHEISYSHLNTDWCANLCLESWDPEEFGFLQYGPGFPETSQGKGMQFGCRQSVLLGNNEHADDDDICYLLPGLPTQAELPSKAVELPAQSHLQSDNIIGDDVQNVNQDIANADTTPASSFTTPSEAEVAVILHLKDEHRVHLEADTHDHKQIMKQLNRHNIFGRGRTAEMRESSKSEVKMEVAIARQERKDREEGMHAGMVGGNNNIKTKYGGGEDESESANDNVVDDGSVGSDESGESGVVAVQSKFESGNHDIGENELEVDDSELINASDAREETDSLDTADTIVHAETEFYLVFWSLYVLCAGGLAFFLRKP